MVNYEKIADFRDDRVGRSRNQMTGPQRIYKDRKLTAATSEAGLGAIGAADRIIREMKL